MVFEVQRGGERRWRQQGWRWREVERAPVVRVVVTPEQVGRGHGAAVEHERRGGRVVGHSAGGAVGRSAADRAAASSAATEADAPVAVAVASYCRYLTRS